MKAVLLLLLFFVVSPVYGQTVLEEINGDISLVSTKKS